MQILCDENGYVSSYAFIGSLVDGIEVPMPEDENHFSDHFCAYTVEDGKLVFDEKQAAVLANKEMIDDIRHRRETECFPIVNRGQLWYDKLSKKKKEELEQWYQAWLDTTNTGVVPEKLAWL